MGPNRETKRDHHFTPILYLKNFTDRDGSLHVVRRPNGSRYTTGPKGVGFERDLYRPDDPEAQSENPNVFEDWFLEFEGKAAPVIREVVSSRQMPSDGDKLQALFEFIAIQASRIPSTKRVIAGAREREAEIIINLLQASKPLYESQARKAGYDLKEFPHERLARGKYKPVLTTEGFIEGLTIKVNAILPYLANRLWSVVSSERPGETFVVSDHPVCLEWSTPPLRDEAVGHAHLESDLTIPLSSHVALLGRYQPIKLNSTRIRHHVSAINTRTIQRSTIFVAASEEAFVLQMDGRIASSDEFIEHLSTIAKRRENLKPQLKP